MTRYTAAYQDVVLLREDLDDLKGLHLYPVTTHPAGHTHAFHNAAGIRRVTQRTRSTLTIMLTMRLLTDTMEPVTLYNALETLAFRSTYYLDLLAFCENVYGNGLT